VNGVSVLGVPLNVIPLDALRDQISDSILFLYPASPCSPTHRRQEGVQRVEGGINPTKAARSALYFGGILGLGLKAGGSR